MKVNFAAGGPGQPESRKRGKDGLVTDNSGRWFRFAWLERLPVLGHLFRDRRPRCAPRKRPPCPLTAEQLEKRETPNDPLGMTQAALFGTSVGIFVPSVSQVMAHGWGIGQLDYDPAAASSRDGVSVPPLRADLADASFASLNVVPVPDSSRGSPVQAEYTPAQAPQQVVAGPLHPGPAEDGVRPTVLGSFLNQVDEALKQPLPSTEAQTGLHVDPAGVKLGGPNGIENGGGGGAGRRAACRPMRRRCAAAWACPPGPVPSRAVPMPRR